MAKGADLVLRQYLGPHLADHAPLVMYGLTQLTALLACFTLRERPQPAAPRSAASEPARTPAGPAPPSTYEGGIREKELYRPVQ
jgi:hypothetical protein